MYAISHNNSRILVANFVKEVDVWAVQTILLYVEYLESKFYIQKTVLMDYRIYPIFSC